MDANNDGRLDQADKAAELASRFAEMDADKNGARARLNLSRRMRRAPRNEKTAVNSGWVCAIATDRVTKDATADGAAAA